MLRWIIVLVALVGCMGSHEEVQNRGKNMPKPAAFDGKRAKGYLEAICAIGPRMSGTQGMKKQQELMRKHFEGLGLKVQMQAFRAQQNNKLPVDMANMIVSFAPEKKKRVILCSHYDTRPIADQEDDQRKWNLPFLSANDGGSGVALLMELASHLKNLKLDVGVDLVFFDGEEYVFRKGDDYFFGSKFFAKTWKEDRNRPDYVAAILLDMVAGYGATFPYDHYSGLRAEGLVNEVWGVAKDIGVNSFQMKEGPTVLDDHLALQDVGIPAIDIIDFEYRHWHKLSDTPENCSADSMTKVANVLSVWLQTK